MNVLFEEIDLESVYNKANGIEADEEKEVKKDEQKKEPEAEPKEGGSKYSVSELASVLYAFGNDVRLLHLYTSGVEFMPYHEKLNELYDILFDAFDTCAEIAIAHDEKVVNPAKVLEVCTEWKPLEGDKFTAEEICKEVDERGNIILGNIKNVKKYESFVQSKIDDFTAEIDKIVNYVFKQSAE